MRCLKKGKATQYQGGRILDATSRHKSVGNETKSSD